VSLRRGILMISAMVSFHLLMTEPKLKI